MNDNNQNNNTRVPLHIMLRRRREQLCLLQAEIAEALRVTPECVGQWEGGHRRMMIDKLPRLAEILQLDKRKLCVVALREFHPAVHAALFSPDPPAIAGSADVEVKS